MSLVTQEGPLQEGPLQEGALQEESGKGERQGQGKVLGFLVGQVMKETGGKANPKAVNEILSRKLSP